MRIVTIYQRGILEAVITKLKKQVNTKDQFSIQNGSPVR